MVKEAPKKKKSNPLLPIIGIVLALLYGVIAYVAIFEWNAQQFLRTQGVTFGTLSNNIVNLLIGATIWLLLFGISMFLVAVLTGRDPDEDHAIKFNKETERKIKARRLEKQRKKRK